MIDFQIDKVKFIRKKADLKEWDDWDIRSAIMGLCDVVLELLATEKLREERDILNK